LAYIKSVRIIAAIKTLRETIATGLKLSSEKAVNINDVPNSRMSNSRESQFLKVGV
jgi:hypothetical protein